MCLRWCLFNWSERENLRPHSVTSHWYGLSPAKQFIILHRRCILFWAVTQTVTLPVRLTCVFTAVHLQMWQLEVFLVAAGVNAHKRTFLAGNRRLHDRRRSRVWYSSNILLFKKKREKITKHKDKFVELFFL